MHGCVCVLYVYTYMFTELCSQVLSSVIKWFQKDTLLGSGDPWAVTRVTLVQKEKPCGVKLPPSPVDKAFLKWLTVNLRWATRRRYQAGTWCTDWSTWKTTWGTTEIPLHLNEYRAARTIKIGSFGELK